MTKFTGHTSAIAQDAAGVCMRIPFHEINQASTNTSLLAQDSVRKIFTYRFITIPTLPAGVDYVVPTFISVAGNIAVGFLLAKLVNFGLMATNTWTGTGATMGTAVEGGATNNLSGQILAVVETALNSTAGNLTVTYVDQDGNTAEAGSAQAITVSSAIYTSAFYNLNAGDSGARSVSTVTRSGAGTGNIRLYGVLPVAVLGIPVGTTTSSLNMLSEVGQFQKFVAGDTIAILNYGNSAGARTGMIHFTGFSNT